MRSRWRQPIITAALVLFDAFVVMVAPFAGLWLRYDGAVPEPYLATIWQTMPVILLVRIISFKAFGLYNRIWHYASINELFAVAGATTIGTALLYFYYKVSGSVLPLSMFVVSWFFIITMVGFSRLSMRLVKRLQTNSTGSERRVLIVGAGDTGALFARNLLERCNSGCKLMGFIDDDPQKWGQQLFGVRILGDRTTLQRQLRELKVSEVLIAIPTVDQQMIDEIKGMCQSAGCELKIAGGFNTPFLGINESHKIKQMGRPQEKVCVVGLGYIGLPTASLLATKGFNVHGVDVNPKTVEAVNAGEVPIFEPELDILVLAATQSGRLKAATNPISADVFILCLPTPFKEGNKPDLSYVKLATQAIAPYVTAGNIIILESTSPVSTTEHVADWLRELRPDLQVPTRDLFEVASLRTHQEIYIAHCPERVLPGQILRELVENDRIIGGINKQSAEMAKQFYAQFVKGHIFLTDSRTAELSKLAENAYRDVNIAFANELSLVCDKLEINVWELIEMANRHPRVDILQPGPGVGGHCIAVDPWFIVDAAPAQAKMIRMAREINDSRPQYIVEQIRNKAANFRHPTIACLGLAFKGGVDDLRESPAVEIVKRLAKSDHWKKIMVVEPYTDKMPEEFNDMENIERVDLQKALDLSDIVLLLVNHPVFSTVDHRTLFGKVVLDTRGLWR